MIDRIATPDNALPPPKVPPVVTPKATSNEMAGAGRIASELLTAFPWGRTAEGNVFWRSVYDRCRQIASDGVLKDPE